MRTTVRIDDDLLVELKARAEAEGQSLTRMFNRTLRRALKAPPEDAAQPFKQRTFRMGAARLGVDKALALAAALEDEEVTRKMSLRK